MRKLMFGVKFREEKSRLNHEEPHHAIKEVVYSFPISKTVTIGPRLSKKDGVTQSIIMVPIFLSL